ncbi:DUF4383 domain-containing protein [Allostreptomyces psammosilenae]|uniref:DUF4383 domain-containing protein n=1 Tax=Allostreptomyces psammosilenae TaxID=1892865 RepID=A0A852ZZ52_9ACTN|nr:DUF4383 domain-containing protein [Allostreptomyces psammosilenae]NYI07355.1 hypothetical protein [Allostreptomyces psammosilenae]
MADEPVTPDARESRPGGALRTVVRLVSVVFLLVGILGFVPGVTTDYDTMTFAGHESRAELFGIFQVSVLHNLVHLLYGIVGLLMSGTAGRARAYLVGGGVVYLLLWLYGLLIDKESGANFVPLNSADDWLHLALGVGMVLLGLVLPGRTPRTRGAHRAARG